MQQVMDIEWLRRICLAFANTSEQVQWGYDLVFKVHGKMFAIAPLEPARVVLSFKCGDERFAELTERPEIIPAPYLARAKWVALETTGAVGKEELAELLRDSYEMVLAKIPKRLKDAGQKTAARKSAASKKAKRKKPAVKKARR